MAIKYDADSHDVMFHLDGDPRFDVEAMKARTLAIRAETAQMRSSGAGFAPPPVQIIDVSGAAAASPADPADLIAALERLSALHASGAVSDEQLEAMKTLLVPRAD